MKKSDGKKYLLADGNKVTGAVVEINERRHAELPIEMSRFDEK